MKKIKGLLTVAGLLGTAILGIVLDGMGVHPILCILVTVLCTMITMLIYFMTEEY